MFLENESGKIPKKRRELFEKSYFNFRHVGNIFLEKKEMPKSLLFLSGSQGTTTI